MLGETISNGRLKLVQRLGEGAYGVVYRAVETEPSSSSSSNTDIKEYAVKVLAKAPESSRRWLFQQREILGHKVVSENPNVVTLHRVIEKKGYVYLVTDYCPGGDMFSAIMERRMFCGRDDLIKKVFVQIVDAVHSCHEKGIFHRDLKPDNIFCMDKDASEIALGDFGLSTSSTKSRSFGCGSAYYLSPGEYPHNQKIRDADAYILECIGKEFDFRPYSPQTGDVWALGIILCNMIVGRNPWHYATTDDQCFLRFMANPEYLPSVLPISEAANQIFRRIFTFDPSSRITIPELRELILEADTFFMAPEQVAKSRCLVKIVAETYTAIQPRSLCSADIRAIREEEAIFNRSENMLDGVVVEDPADHFRIVNVVGTTTSAFAAAHYDSDSGSGSDDECEGPITPESHPQDSNILVEVPDFPSEENMGISLVPIAQKKLGQGPPVESLVERLAKFAL